ncbi:MAG: sigma 54-interacting transcriptional regulator [Polyangiaceae bacterium]|nr:sigma 54-interacting transcriptional regulator [Polyangiaceae bacterium]
MPGGDQPPESRTLELVDANGSRRVRKERRYLFVVLEAQRPFSGGARFAIDDVDEILIGRGAQRSFDTPAGAPRTRVLTLPDKVVSSRHARIVAEGDGLYFEDLGSRNGSRVDDITVPSRVSLGHQSIIEVGGTFLSIHASASEGAPCRDVDFARAPAPSLGLATLLPDYETRLADLAQVAIVDIPILLLGETGTGKELLARAVHALSYKSGAFVPVNCGALPSTLIESNLFGHVRGSFSGAARDEVGLVRSSHRGTLFLDEIAELPRPSQAALLRVLQEREVLPVGATKPVPVDLRVVAATHQTIESADDRFRADLFARLAGFTLHIPPLRDRIEDLGVIIAGIIGQHGDPMRGLKLATPLARALLSHDFPYNARELQQLLSVGAALVREGELDLKHLPEGRLASKKRTQPGLESPVVLDDDTRALKAELVQHLERSGGNVSEVSRTMGKTRMQIHRWMKRFGVDPAQFRR